MENSKNPTKQYDPSDYNSESEESKGLAMTHEQVSDSYIEGTVDAVINNVNEKETPQQSLRKQ